MISGLTPLTPFFSLSSMKSERYSGEREFRLRKYSKSPAIVCLKRRSLLKDSWRKRSKRDFRSSKPCRKTGNAAAACIRRSLINSSYSKGKVVSSEKVNLQVSADVVKEEAAVFYQLFSAGK